MIQLNNISKSYAEKRVIKKLSCQVEQGILHITGGNGSGKTTLLNLMAGSLAPDEGEILYLGLHLYGKFGSKIKNTIGYIPDTAPIYPFLSGHDFLKFICNVKKSEWPLELIETLDLERHLSTSFHSMSYGTRKKLLFVSGMLGKPKYLLLDEPINGLDQQAKNEIDQLITKHLCSNGICVIVSHDLSWINKWRENFCYQSITMQIDYGARANK